MRALANSSDNGPDFPGPRVTLASPSGGDRRSSSERTRRTTADLLDLTAVITESADPESLLGEVASATARLCAVARCSILCWRDNHLAPAVTEPSCGPDTAERTRAFKALGPYRLEQIPAVKRAAVVGEPVTVAAPAATFELPPDWTAHFGRQHSAIVPLLRGDQLVGTIHLDDAGAEITDHQLRPATVVARHLALALDHAKVVAQTRRRFHEKNRLLRVALTVGSTLDMEEVLRRVARESARSVGADTGGIYFLGADARVLQPLVGYHVPRHLRELVQQRHHSLDDFRRLAMLLAHDRPSVWSDNVPRDANFNHEIFRTLGMQSLFVTLLRAGADVLGVLVCVWWTKRHRFDAETLSLLEGIAGLAGVALANAGLHSQVEATAINRERIRVAHELHDTLNQTVFSTALKLDACVRDIPPGAPGLRDKLEDIRRNTVTIMANIRQLIYGLTPQQCGSTTLSERIRSVIDEARGLSGIPIEFTEHGNLGKLERPQQEVLLKIVQESLANVVKHSHASRAAVSIDILSEEVRFSVADDGVGMPLATDRVPVIAGHFGLQQVQERLDMVGGELLLDNLSPSGFRVAGGFPITR